MIGTRQRDDAIDMAKSDPTEALGRAHAITDPWFRAQALSWVARFTDGDPVVIAAEAAESALSCDDNYKRAAVRAWEIAALAERGFTIAAQKSLREAIALAQNAEPPSSRSEALYLLLEASFKIGHDDAAEVYEVLKASCRPDEHWRCKRAVRHGEKLMSGEMPPRSFFW